jgi:DNA-binding transcriptional LysR family regulator
MTIENVELRHLRVFAAVARTQNFSHAARACGLSQSSVSTILQQLEASLGVQLIDRTTRKVVLSQIGEDFLPGVKRILDDVDRQLQGLEDLRTFQSGQVHLACVPSVAMRLLPRVIERFRQDFPRVGVKLSEVPRGTTMAMVRNGEADFAIANEPGDASDVESTRLMEDVFALVMRRDHPLAGRAEVTWAQAQAAGLVMMGAQTGIRLEIRHGLPEGTPDVTALYEAEHPVSLLAMVERGLGVAPLPSLAWPPPENRLLTIRPLTRPRVTRTLHLIQRAGRSLSPGAWHFRRTIITEATREAIELEELPRA